MTIRHIISAVLLSLLVGCATTGLTDITQTDVSQDELQAICSPHRLIPTLFGCKKQAFGRCYIYVLRLEEHPSPEEYRDTVVHERKHCLLGQFHN